MCTAALACALPPLLLAHATALDMALPLVPRQHSMA